MKMTHPEAKKPVEVDPRAVEAYRSQGWSEVAEKAPAKPVDDKK